MHVYQRPLMRFIVPPLGTIRIDRPSGSWWWTYNGWHGNQPFLIPAGSLMHGLKGSAPQLYPQPNRLGTSMRAKWTAMLMHGAGACRCALSRVLNTFSKGASCLRWQLNFPPHLAPLRAHGMVALRYDSALEDPWTDCGSVQWVLTRDRKC